MEKPVPRYTPLPTASVRALQSGSPDVHGQVPERKVSDGDGVPCRHCLCEIPAGKDMLVLAYRPFPNAQPYAETGPIFLCAEECAPFDGDGVPEILTTSPSYLIKGYGDDHRIVYGTGSVVPTKDLDKHTDAILADDRVAYVHVRSARNNCYQARAERS